jgi:hypothetical protein
MAPQPLAAEEIVHKLREADVLNGYGKAIVGILQGYGLLGDPATPVAGPALGTGPIWGAAMAAFGARPLIAARRRR